MALSRRRREREFPVGALDEQRGATLVWARLITANHSAHNVIDAAVHAFR
jgi:hypothetical protein